MRRATSSSDWTPKVRELTQYEQVKWFDKYNRFEAPEYISYGNELGETYDSLVRAEENGTYLPDDLVLTLQIGILDMYYDQLGYYHGAYSEEPEEVGLPSRALVIYQQVFYLNENPNSDIANRRVWDWAMQWREDHLNETSLAQREERLLQELLTSDERKLLQNIFGSFLDHTNNHTDQEMALVKKLGGAS